jgi:hypothetical protein
MHRVPFDLVWRAAKFQLNILRLFKHAHNQTSPLFLMIHPDGGKGQNA